MKHSVLVWHAEEQQIFSREAAENLSQKKMIIGEKYCKIQENAFKNNIKIHTVICGKNVKEIGKNAFNGCTSLRHMGLGGIWLIQKAAFYNCTRLLEADIPRTCKYIGERTFALCKRLRTVRFDADCPCRELKRETFSGCVSLEEIILPENLHVIGEKAFFKCVNLNTIKIPASVETIESGAFRGCRNLKVLEIGHEPNYLGEGIFNRNIKIRCKKGGKVEKYCIQAGIETEYLE